MKKKILIISIISILCIVIICYCISKNRISNMQVSEDSILEIENDLSSMEISNDIVNIEENLQGEEIETVTQPQTTEVKTSTKTTSKVETNDVKTKSEVTKENKPTKVDISSTVTKQDTNAQEQPKQEIKVQEPETPKCSDTKHGVGVGNSNKWFNSYNEAVSYYDNLINDFSNQIHNGKITSEEYNKKCPYGYEIWSCPYCSKWTLNFYYR